ncbi:hypothetical protein EST38_g3851 [Candolleomyces aberdarensis]|uniref:F-box domain-containing protein n=1 Tax=Candolleomyces aberdarensis TaxID=2316362 RepID=A0A4Q2DT50_9AGAR|nr:hypothetical protein EST38_g3851 [Candolleomyces aberdarensis]
MSRPSGFDSLPRELLIKIFQEFDNGAILNCTTVSTYFNSVGVDVILHRHNIVDASAFCEVKVLVNAKFARPVDPLAALLASARPPNRIKHLHCTIRLTTATSHFGAGTLEYPPMSRDRLEITGVFALRRLNLFLSKLKAVDKVTLNLSGLKYGLMSTPDVGPLLADLVHNIIQKGCRVLQVKSKRSPFGDQPWTFPIPDQALKSPSTRRFTISSILSSIFSLCGVFKFSKKEPRKHGHRRIHSEASISPPTPQAILPRVSKLDIDSSFFHPTGSSWMSDLLAYSPLTELVVSLHSSSTPDFVQRGFPTLLQTVPRLQSLTLLSVGDKVIQNIMPRLRPFVALKHLSVCLDNHLSSQPISVPDTSTPFAPSNLQSLSLSPQLIDYMILGTVTALNLKEFEIVYGQHAQVMISSICQHVKSVRDFYEKISAPMAITLTLSCVRGVSFPSSSSSDDSDSSPQEEADGSPGVINMLEAQYRTDLATVNTLQIELLPNGLEGEKNMENVLKLLSFFPKIKKLHLRGAKDFRHATGPLAVPRDVRQVVVQPVYSTCSTLAALYIADEPYQRPLINI